MKKIPITTFFEQTSTFPTYFYFDYKTKQSNFYYNLKDIQNDNLEHICNINIKNMNESMYLCIDKKYSDMFVVKEKSYDKHIISIMKSNLQKCVRRKETDIAMKIGKYMIENSSIAELLRRLVIICLEDTILNPNLVTLTWLMMVANKNYVFDDLLNNWILGFIAQISETEYFDNISFEDDPVIHKKKVLFSKLQKLNEIQRNCIICLVIRISYGGLGGDTHMLYNFINTWCDRFQKNLKSDIANDYFNNIPKISKIGMVGNLTKNELLLAGFDFHCTDIIKLMQKDIEMDESILKNLIWTHSSSINNRKLIRKCSKKDNDNNKEKWNDIKESFNKYATHLRDQLNIHPYNRNL
ncbi:MAG: hypothetical protein Edafosvirus2_43 [Edafosvirus sp.]|uniref:Uncharacterized protein n=1 Tax=Edafosvirus sp. TaxID=2487765 RepID=A0A3G4ZU74_9VIRU|nr:MAG: hypothetical protein Edafosvirus2_43 [Edafosvirus sp.]